MKDFKFFVSTDLRFGNNQSEKLPEYLKDLGYQKAAVIIDKGVVGNVQIKKTLDALKESNVKSADIYVNESVEPSYDYLEEFKGKLIGKNYDCLIGIGGGSVLDLTKGIATLLTNPGPALSYRGFPKLKNRPLPVIAIPTTAGTASEVTYNAVFTDTKEKKKLGINSTFNFPVMAIIDPLITMDCPISVSISAGADALVHTMESFVNKNNTVYSRMFSKEAFRILFNNLSKIPGGFNDIDVRGNLALGAYLAGIALINAGAGAAGGLSYSLGVHFKVPHGIAGAVFLAAITNFNVKKGYQDYAELYDLIDGADKILTKSEKNKEFAVRIERLMNDMNIPKLSVLGLKKDDLEFLAEQYENIKGAVDQNPIQMIKADIKQIIEQQY